MGWHESRRVSCFGERRLPVGPVGSLALGGWRLCWGPGGRDVLVTYEPGVALGV